MASKEFTEEEQSRYDRQIRLWGIEAQQRMRNATILVVRLQGTATETIKNIVLAGIGKLIMVDDADVSEEDLGAGFFFRDGDVGKKRVLVAKARVESLNPLVTVEAVPTTAVLEPQNVEASLAAVNLVCVTDSAREELIRINQACRKQNVPFYCGGTYGLVGYIFCDLLAHEYIAPDRVAATTPAKNVKTVSMYCPLDVAIHHSWAGLTKRQTKLSNPTTLYAILGLWEYESQHGSLPDSQEGAAQILASANALIEKAQINQQVLSVLPPDLAASLATTARHEFSPVCAIIGGLLGQDILKCLGAKEPPIANFLTFDGNLGGATTARMSMQ